LKREEEKKKPTRGYDAWTEKKERRYCPRSPKRKLQSTKELCKLEMNSRKDRRKARQKKRLKKRME